MSSIVTGEAVVLDLRPASFASRMLALALDLLIQLAVAVGLVILVGTVASGLDGAAARALAVVLLVALVIGVPTTLETLTRGRSVGKFAAGLRVVRDDGGPERFRQALLRALVGFVEIYLLFGSPALICSLSNARGKRLGDLVAGTYVIRERTAARNPSPVAMPPWLAGWAAAADLATLPDPLALAARQFLSRAGGLHAQSRGRLATELANEVSRYVSPPPPGTHPEAFLAAVLAERRDRDLARLSGPRSSPQPSAHPATPPAPTTPPPPSTPPPPATPAPAPPRTGGGFAPPS